MLDDFENSSSLYRNQLDVSLYDESDDLVDQVLNNRAAEINQERQLTYYQEYTDYEEKKLRERLDYNKNEFLTNVNDVIDQKHPETPPEESVHSSISKVADPLSLGMTAVKAAAESDIIQDSVLSGVGKGVAKTVDVSRDFINGVKKSIAKTLSAIPQLVEDGLAEIGQAPQGLSDFNEMTTTITNESFKSSGEGKYEGIDIPHVTGEILGHFALPVGVGATVLKATKGLSTLGKGASLYTSEAALNSVLTNKESGAFLNLFWDKDEAEKVPIMLKVLHVDEDDSAFEARLKGALEGVVQVGAFQTIGAGLKKISKSARAIRDVAVIKHLNDEPDVALNYVNKLGDGEFNEKDFNKYVFNDFVKKEVDSQYNSFSSYLKDDTGSMSIFGSIDDTKRVADEISDVTAKEIEKKLAELDQISTSKTKSKAKTKKASKLKEDIVELKKEHKEYTEFKGTLNNAKKTGDIKPAHNKFRDVIKRKRVQTKIKSKMEHNLRQMQEYTDFFDDVRKSDLTTYNSLKHIFTNINSKHANSEMLKDANFLGAMAKQDSHVNDLVAIAKKDKSFQKEIDEANKEFFNFDVKNSSDAQISKAINDFSSVYGLDPEQLKYVERKQLMSLPEVVMAEQYLLKQGLENLGNVSSRLTSALADGSVNSKKTLQLQTINFIESYKGMQKLSKQVAQRRTDIGTSLRLYRKDVRADVFEKVSSDKFNLDNVLRDDLQEQFISKLLTADPGEAKRMANRINDVVRLMKDGKLNEIEALAKLAKGEAWDKVLHNVSTFAYNNMLWGPTTAIKNVAGLTTNFLLNKAEDSIIRAINQKAYYGMEDIADLETQKEILDIINHIDSNAEASMDLISSSKFFSGIRNDDGTLKSSKSLFKESFYSGKSVIDPGSEKFGVGYKSFTENEKTLLSDHEALFGTKDINNVLAKNYFHEKIMNDATEILSHDESLKKIKGEWFHSAPLRLLNATDDAFKAAMVHKKMGLIAKQRVNRMLSSLDETRLKDYKKDFKNNYLRDLKDHYSSEVNFEEAMGAAREMSLTKQYGAFTGEEFRFLGANFSKMSRGLQENKVLKFFYPFARISVNMADYLTQYLPGYVKVPKKIFGKTIGKDDKYFAFNNKVADELAAGGYRKAKAITKMGVGLGISAMAVASIKSNFITGAAPHDQFGKYQWKQAGLQPYSFNFGSFSVPLNMMDPFGKYLSFVADVYNSSAKQYNDDNEAFGDDVVPLLLESSYALGSMAIPEVLTETMGLIHRIGTSEYKTSQSLYEGTRKLSTLFSKAIPFSGFLKTVEKMTSIDSLGISGDEVTRTFEYNKEGVDDMATIWNTFKKNVPFASTTAVKNVFNDNVYYYNLPREVVGEGVDQNFIDSTIGAFSSVMSGLGRAKQKRSDPIYGTLKRLSLNLPTLSFSKRELPIPKLGRRLSYENESVSLTNDQYNELVGYANGYLPSGKQYTKPMKEYLNELVEQAWFKKEADEFQALMIRNVIKKYQKYGRDMFKQNNDQFQEDIISKLNQRMGLE
tara:strand:+ start:647 stop:5194 length:4548 start_codon:yes stop_codon:yes gene_type:complete